MGLVAELRRRNVFRMAVLYVLAAWVVMQVAGVLMDLGALPDAIGPRVLALLVIGFPIALVFSWLFEITPEGLTLEKDVPEGASITDITGRRMDFIVIAVLSAGLILFAYDKWWGGPPPDRSIAVLPFVNMSSDPEQEYFSDGLSEEILNLLAKIPSLKVIGRTSSFAFKGKNEDLRVIGQTLGVSTLLEGSVRKDGDRVRITAQLINVEDGAHLWSESYDRTITDIFTAQEDVAASIIDALQIHVSEAPTRGRPTNNMDAYLLFTSGKVFLSENRPGQAEAQLNNAILLDPSFAEAYEQLAWLYYRQSDRTSTYEVASKALELNPDLVLAQALQESASDATASTFIEPFERALRNRPNDPHLMSALSWALLQAGYLQEAVRLQEQVVELEPLSIEANEDLYAALHSVGRDSEAGVIIERARQLGDASPTLDLGLWHLADGHYDLAIAHLEELVKLQTNNSDPTWIRELVSVAHDPIKGQAYLDQLVPKLNATRALGNSERNSIRLYSALGFLDRYFELILGHQTEGDIVWDGLAAAWLYDAIVDHSLGTTSHPKFLEFAKSMGIIEVWEKRGPPDICEKQGRQWVCGSGH